MKYTLYIEDDAGKEFVARLKDGVGWTPWVTRAKKLTLREIKAVVAKLDDFNKLVVERT